MNISTRLSKNLRSGLRRILLASMGLRLITAGICLLFAAIWLGLYKLEAIGPAGASLICSLLLLGLGVFVLRYETNPPSTNASSDESSTDIAAMIAAAEKMAVDRPWSAVSMALLAGSVAGSSDQAEKTILKLLESLDQMTPKEQTPE